MDFFYNRDEIDDKLIASFEHYLGLQGVEITRARAEERMLEKLNRSLTEDITPLLPPGVTFTDAQAIDAFERIWRELISRIKGEPWKLSARNIEKIRTTNLTRFSTLATY